MVNKNDGGESCGLFSNKTKIEAQPPAPPSSSSLKGLPPASRLDEDDDGILSMSLEKIGSEPAVSKSGVDLEPKLATKPTYLQEKAGSAAAVYEETSTKGIIANETSSAVIVVDDLGSTDEVKIFKDEGERDDENFISEQNLYEEKSSLIHLTENEDKSGKGVLSNRDNHVLCGGKPAAEKLEHPQPSILVSSHPTPFNMTYHIMSPYSTYPGNPALALPNKIGFPSFIYPSNNSEQPRPSPRHSSPPPAHCGIPPYRIDPKPIGPSSFYGTPFGSAHYGVGGAPHQYHSPYSLLGPEITASPHWHGPSMYSTAAVVAGFRNSAFGTHPNRHDLNSIRFPQLLLPHSTSSTPGLSSSPYQDYVNHLSHISSYPLPPLNAETGLENSSKPGYMLIPQGSSQNKLAKYISYPQISDGPLSSDTANDCHKKSSLSQSCDPKLLSPVSNKKTTNKLCLTEAEKESIALAAAVEAKSMGNSEKTLDQSLSAAFHDKYGIDSKKNITLFSKDGIGSDLNNCNTSASVKSVLVQNKKPHIKKPLNAFMLYMKEMRAKVVAECTLKESAAINQILGRRWHSLSREEQSKYYEKARQERQLHMELYPGWSARDNYGYGSKKKKRKKDRGSPSDISSGNSMKKCRARYGLEQQNQWCKPCRRKKKCIKYMESLLLLSKDHSSEDDDEDEDDHSTSFTKGSEHMLDDFQKMGSDGELMKASNSGEGSLLKKDFRTSVVSNDIITDATKSEPLIYDHHHNHHQSSSMPLSSNKDVHMKMMTSENSHQNLNHHHNNSNTNRFLFNPEPFGIVDTFGNKMHNHQRFEKATPNYLPPSPAASSSSSLLGHLSLLPSTNLSSSAVQHPQLMTPATLSSSDQQSPQASFETRKTPGNSSFNPVDLNNKKQSSLNKNNSSTTKVKRRRKKRKKKSSITNKKNCSTIKKLLMNTILSANQGTILNEKEKVTELIETLIRKMENTNGNRPKSALYNEVISAAETRSTSSSSFSSSDYLQSSSEDESSHPSCTNNKASEYLAEHLLKNQKSPVGTDPHDKNNPLSVKQLTSGQQNYEN